MCKFGLGGLGLRDSVMDKPLVGEAGPVSLVWVIGRNLSK